MPLEEVDDVCKTYKSTAASNPRLFLQLPVKLRVRFIDLLTAFEAKLVKPLYWAHMMMLRPKPSGGHRTIGLTVAPSRVLSVYAGHWHKSWKTITTRTISGAARARRAIARLGRILLWWRQQRGASISAASLLLQARRARSSLGRRATKQASQGDCWPVGALPTKAGVLSKQTSVPPLALWTFGTILPGCSGATSCQTDVGSSPRNSVNTAPDLQASERCRRHYGACGGWVPQDGSGPLGRGSQAFGGGPSRRATLPLSVGKPKVLIDRQRTSSSRDSCGSWGALGIDECDTAAQRWGRFAAGQASTRPRRQGVTGKGQRQERKCARQQHARNLTLTGSNGGVSLGFGGSWAFTPAQHRTIRVDAAKATFRLSRGQNAATTMMAQAQAAGAKNIDPAFRQHRQVVLAWAAGVCEGAPDLGTMQSATRFHCQAQPSQEAVVWGHLRAPVAAVGMERAVCQAPHHSTTARISTPWQWRRRRWVSGSTRPL